MAKYTFKLGWLAAANVQAHVISVNEFNSAQLAYSLKRRCLTRNKVNLEGVALVNNETAW